MTTFGVIAPLADMQTAREVGADYVEPPIVGNVLVDSGGRWTLNRAFVGKRFASFAILFPGSLRLSDPSAEARSAVDDYVAEIFPQLSQVAEPGAKIVFGSGSARQVPDGVPMEDGASRFAEVLVQVRDAASRHGLQILLEPLHKGETNLVNSIVEAADLLDRHAIDGIPIVADLFHIMLEDEPLDVIRTHAARIGHAHVADSERRYLGSGDWPWREFVATLRESGYSGPVTLECRWGEDFAGELETSLEGLRAL